MADDALHSQRCAELLRALAEPLRLRIIDILRRGPMNVGDLSAELKSEVVTVSHHLTILRSAGIVERERQGRFMVYRLTSVVFEPSQKPNTTEFINLGCCRLEIPKQSQPE